MRRRITCRRSQTAKLLSEKTAFDEHALWQKRGARAKSMAPLHTIEHESAVRLAGVITNADARMSYLAVRAMRLGGRALAFCAVDGLSPPAASA